MAKYARGSTISTSGYYAHLPSGTMMQIFPLIPKEMDIFEMLQIRSAVRRGECIVGHPPYESGLIPGGPNYTSRGKMVVGMRK